MWFGKSLAGIACYMGLRSMRQKDAHQESEETEMNRKLTRCVYGYGIVGKSGTPWWDEACVAKYYDSLALVVLNLNEIACETSGAPTDQPYRIVRLFYETSKR